MTVVVVGVYEFVVPTVVVELVVGDVVVEDGADVDVVSGCVVVTT